MEPTLSLVQVLWMVELRLKAGMRLAFHLPEPPQPRAEAASSALEIPLGGRRNVSSSCACRKSCKREGVIISFSR